MNTQPNPNLEERLQEVARRFQYPPTPDVSGAVMKRFESGIRSRARLRSAWVGGISLLVLMLAVLFAVPGVRAEIIRFFQVGVVRIFPPVSTLTAEPSMPGMPPIDTPGTDTSSSVTLIPGTTESLYTITVLGLAGETSLEDAQASLPFSIRLPEYPADLGAPDRVFLQEEAGMVILVWTDRDNPDDVRLSLHEFGPEGFIVSKYEPHVIQETQVNGNYAVWTRGPHMLQMTDGEYEFRRLVEGNTLIWEKGGLTYRLETDLTLEEALEVAESLE